MGKGSNMLGQNVEYRVNKRTGYVEVGLMMLGRQRTLLVHRLVLEAFVGECPSGMEACHENNQRSDPRLQNLRWDTRKNNHADKKRHGTMANGDRNGNAKLTPNDVIKIKQGLKAGKSRRSLGIEFRVDTMTIVCIARGDTWRHVTC